MLLGYFTEEAYDELLNDIPKNAERYSEKEEWLSLFFNSTTNYFKSSTVEVNKFTPYIIPGEKDDKQKSIEDLANTRLIYSAFKNLTPLQAANKYMWTYLCHAIPEYRDYIQDRWMREERQNTIKSRFFVTTPESLRDNALSRLWWFGYLTYEPQNSNPFELTDILFTNQTICTDVMDTLNRTNLDRIRGVLLAIKDFKNELSYNEGITEYFRECKKYLNHYAAVTTMEFLESEDIRKLAYDYMMNLRFEKNRNKSGVRRKNKR